MTALNLNGTSRDGQGPVIRHTENTSDFCSNSSSRYIYYTSIVAKTSTEAGLPKCFFGNRLNFFPLYRTANRFCVGDLE
jgi:hypothetical protein